MRLHGRFLTVLLTLTLAACDHAATPRQEGAHRADFPTGALTAGSLEPGANAFSMSPSSASRHDPNAPLFKAEGSVAATPAEPPPPTSSSPIVNPQAGRQVVYRASLAIRLAGAEAAARRCESLAKELGGFVSASGLNQVTFRLPPENFETALSRIESMGEVTDRSVTSQDITAEVTDMDIRLSVARKALERLQQLVANAKETKDLLEIEKEIARVTAEIESMEGQRRVYKDQVDFATISVHFEDKQQDQTSWKPSALDAFPAFADIGLAPLYRVFSEGAIAHPLFGTDFRLGGPGQYGEPEGFVAIERTANSLMATTPEASRIGGAVIELQTKAAASFYEDVIRKQLSDGAGYEFISREELAMSNPKLSGAKLSFKTRYGNANSLFDVYVIHRGAADEARVGELLVIQHGRSADAPAKEADTVRKSVETLKY